MSPLLIKPARGAADGRVHHITPASAGWSYVGFEVFDLASEQALAQATENGGAALARAALKDANDQLIRVERALTLN